MVFEIGVNLRVTECLDRGDRPYMEDFSKCYFERIDGSIVFGFFGIFDGHGGSEAAAFVKKTLIDEIKKIPLFWSVHDNEVLSSIKQGFLNTHNLMWTERGKWSKTISGFDSTAGTTATIAIVRNKKLYIGHVGDSACALGFSKLVSSRTDLWESICLTVEHKPSNITERARIEKNGGSLAKKSGVERVVWKRPKINNSQHDSLCGDSSKYEEIPFLAVTRSLGDLWSYDTDLAVYHISPDPDLQCIPLDSVEHRCIILGTDGLWNVVSTKCAIEIVRICERETERRVFLDPNVNSNFFYNPAASLVKYAISQWKHRRVRSDNVSAVVVMIDPPGPSMTKRRDDRRKINFTEFNTKNLFDSKVSTYEAFSELLSKELLIECSRWRSANDSKDDADDQKSDTNQLTSSKNKSAYKISETPFISLIKNLSESTSNHDLQYYNMKTTTNSNVGKTDNICQSVIRSHSLYSIYCETWNSKTKIWDFLRHYLQMKDITTELDIVGFLKSIEQHKCCEILKMMPWIYNAKKTFKDNNQLHASLSFIPIFCDFWLDLYSKFIKPYRRSNNNRSSLHMDTILGLLKPNIVSLLKQHNYLLSQRTADKATKNNRPDSDNNKNNSDLPSLCKYLISLTDHFGKKRQNSLSMLDPIEDPIKPNLKTKQLPVKKSKSYEKFSFKSSTGSTQDNIHLTDSNITSRLSAINSNYRRRRGSSLVDGQHFNNSRKIQHLNDKQLYSTLVMNKMLHSKKLSSTNFC